MSWPPSIIFLAIVGFAFSHEPIAKTVTGVEVDAKISRSEFA